MTRKEFLQKLPIGAGMAFSLICTGSCNQAEKLEIAVHKTTQLSTDTLPNPNQPVIDFMINLDTPEYELLKTPGGYTFYNEVIMVFTEEKEYLAATKICSDEFLPGIIWKGGEYFCREHGATFDKSGIGTTTFNDLGKNGIQIYKTQLNGNVLRVYA